ncbi:LPS-assembly protein LptD [Acidovorax soli]|uniref:LPS-assembly protein LptD n=1 Tax=Acidovorax soli TaxID=592050 RepID=UPI003D6D6D84
MQNPQPLSRPVRQAAARARRPGLHPLACAVALAWCGLPQAALAQADAPSAWDAPPLRRSPQLQETLPADLRPQLPVFVSGDRITGQPDVKATIDGHAELRRGDTVIRADRLDYTVPDDLAHAQGSVHINRAGNTYDGSVLELRVDAFQGFFSDARYRFLSTGAHGDSARVDFLDRDRSVVHTATYTTCQKDDSASWAPDWVLRAKSIHLDTAEEVGTADEAVLEFKGVPILPIPHISFPLSDKRKSGLLPPTVGLDSRNGLEYMQPYYWNIAPNRDATLRGAILAKRGVEVGGEFRYLESDYRGLVDVNLMPTDSQRDRRRWGYSAQHQGQISTPVGGVGLNLNLNRVSDDNYWRDFRRGPLPLRQRLLPSDATLSWAAADMSAQVRTLKWQALQDVASPIVPPYNLMPQLLWRYTPQDLDRGLDFSMVADTTRFEADRVLPNPADGQRSFVQAQLSRPFLAPGGFVIPKLQLHATQYQFDNPLRNGQSSASRTLPTFSLDSGLVFERDARLLGRAFTQTLEPRAFYTYTPYRDQRYLPLYDTAATDFNFGTIYTENSYGGNDRLADNNLLTMGVTTRFLDPNTGAEALRLGIAQRLRFSDQNVTLDNTPISERLSDVLLGAGINWTPQWGFDSTVQYNPKTGRSIRSTVGARYSPGNFRTINAVYRLQRGTSEQIDVGWQWPLAALWGGQAAGSGPERVKGQDGGRWYTVGRLNYSLRDRKLVDTVVGFEYDSCCWIGRVVLERLQSSVTTANTRLLFQIEFVGFSRLSLGNNPLDTLKRNVPRYQYLRDQVSTPSRFSNYD